VEQRMNDQSLSSALDFYKKRQKGDLISGIRLLDQNIPGRVIIVVSNSEFYSVLEEDIIDEQGPHRIWLKKGAEVWRSQLVTFGEQKTSQELLPDLTLRPAAPIFEQNEARLRYSDEEFSPEDVQNCFCRTYYWQLPKDKDKPLRQALDKGHFSAADYLVHHWPECDPPVPTLEWLLDNAKETTKVKDFLRRVSNRKRK